MDSVGSVIEKIKCDELNKELLLKEKRELEATKAALIKAIRDTSAFAENSFQQQCDLIKNTDKLRNLVNIQEVRNKALSAILNMLLKELEELRFKSNEGISTVWDLRSSLCEKIYKASDLYDIRTLLMKPICTESSVKTIKKITTENVMVEFDNRVKAAFDRHLKVVAERERLILEPENGVEFVRIKNALKYSLEKIGELQKKNYLNTK